jgi:hypothetical protein
MPEQLTKHPEVTLQVLRSAGARCGEGTEQAILTQCPPERFCKLPGGELCVFGLGDAARMSQISAAEWQRLAAPGGAPAPVAAPGGAPAPVAALGGDALLGGAVGLLAGAAIGVAMSRWRRRR